MDSLAAKIRQYRIAKRMSQEELGDVIGVTRAAVQQWEKGKTTPTLPKLAELARFFGVSLSALMGAPVDTQSIDAELRQLPEEVAMVLRESFLNTIRAMQQKVK